MGLVAIATAIGNTLDVDLTAAALLLLVAVMLATLLGRVASATAIVAGFLALNYFFTAPRDSLDVQKGDDLVALLGVRGGSCRAGLDRLTPRCAAPHVRAARARDPDPARPHDATALGRRPRARDRGCRRGARQPLLARRVHRARRRCRHERQPTRPREARTPWCRSARSRSTPSPASTSSPAPTGRCSEALVAGLATAVDRLRFESEAREARIAAQVGRTRSGFLSAVTHNLRTPLASIKAAASTLRSPRSRLDDADRAELLDTIYDETERLERLVTKILELSRIRAGALEVHRQPVALGGPRAGGGATLAPARPRAPGASRHRPRGSRCRGRRRDDGAGLRQPARERAPVRAARFGDPRLGRVQSATASRCGSPITVPACPRPSVSTSSRSSYGSTREPDATGTGLGLAIVRSLVTAHGGRVWCEETDGGGATFGVHVCRCRPA